MAVLLFGLLMILGFWMVFNDIGRLERHIGRLERSLSERKEDGKL